MVNLQNRLIPPGGPLFQGPNAARDGQGRLGQRQVNAAGRRAPAPQVPPQQNVNQYHALLTQMDLSAATFASLEDMGLDQVESFSDITEKDIPSIVKELGQNNVLVRQMSQNYLQAICYWVMQQECLQLNYLPEDFTGVFEIIPTTLSGFSGSGFS
jgi:hypothetical protein